MVVRVFVPRHAVIVCYCCHNCCDYDRCCCLLRVSIITNIYIQIYNYIYIYYIYIIYILYIYTISIILRHEMMGPESRRIPWK
jgi:hypothetical protein